MEERLRNLLLDNDRPTVPTAQQVGYVIRGRVDLCLAFLLVTAGLTIEFNFCSGSGISNMRPFASTHAARVKDIKQMCGPHDDTNVTHAPLGGRQFDMPVLDGVWFKVYILPSKNTD